MARIQNPLEIDIVVDNVLRFCSSELLLQFRQVSCTWNRVGRSLLRKRNLAQGRILNLTQDRPTSEYISTFEDSSLFNGFELHPDSQPIGEDNENYANFVRAFGSTTKSLLMDEYKIQLRDEIIPEGANPSSFISLQLFRKILFVDFPNLHLISFQDRSIKTLDIFIMKMQPLLNLKKIHYNSLEFSEDQDSLSSNTTLSTILFCISSNLEEICYKANFHSTCLNPRMTFEIYKLFTIIKSTESLKIKSFKFHCKEFRFHFMTFNDKDIEQLKKNVKFKALEISEDSSYHYHPESHTQFYNFLQLTSLNETLETFVLKFRGSLANENFVVPFGFPCLKSLEVNLPPNFTITDSNFGENLRANFPVLEKLTFANCCLQGPLTFNGVWNSLKYLKFDRLSFEPNFLTLEESFNQFSTNLPNLSEFMFVGNFEDFEHETFGMNLYFKTYFLWASYKWNHRRYLYKNFPMNNSSFGPKENESSVDLCADFLTHHQFSFLDSEGLFEVQLGSLDLRNFPLNSRNSETLSSVKNLFPNVFKIMVRIKTDFSEGPDSGFEDTSQIIGYIFESFPLIRDLTIELDMPVKNLEATLLDLNEDQFKCLNSAMKDGNGMSMLNKFKRFPKSIHRLKELKSLNLNWNLTEYLRISKCQDVDSQTFSSFFLTDFGAQSIFDQMKKFQFLGFSLAPIEKIVELKKELQIWNLDTPYQELSFSKVSNKENKIKIEFPYKESFNKKCTDNLNFQIVQKIHTFTAFQD